MTMKKIILFLAFAALNQVCALAQTKYEMVIEKTDGSEVSINVEEIIRTYFRQINSSSEVPAALSSCPDENHPHMIDLGLPSGTLWACCNVGANAPEEYGGRFAWGETEEKSDYNWDTYKYGYYDYNDLSTLIHIGYDISGTKYDIAHTRWGQGWHMPKLSQIEELVANTTAEWYVNDDIMGCQLFGSNGSNIFIPASGLYIDRLDPEISLSWSSTVEKFEELPYSYYSSPFAYTLSIRPVRNPNIGLFVDYCPNLEFRFNGLTVRPVKESNP